MKIDQQNHYRRCLERSFGESKAFNPKFTMRAFAKKLGVPSGALSEVLNGKRSITKKFVDRTIGALKLDPSEKSYFLSGKTGVEFFYLSSTDFDFISDPIHFTLLRLFELKNLDFDLEECADRLGTSSGKVASAIERLEALGLIRTENGRIIPTGKTYHSSDEIPSSAVRQNHLMSLREASEALEKVPLENRDYTNITVSLNKQDLKALKEKIRKFREELLEFCKQSIDKDHVYKLNIQFYPVIKEPK